MPPNDNSVRVCVCERERMRERRHSGGCIEIGLRPAGKPQWKGLKCVEAFYQWKNEDEIELDQDNQNLICIQFSVKGAFANKEADFSVCQLAVRYTQSLVS